VTVSLHSPKGVKACKLLLIDWTDFKTGSAPYGISHIERSGFPIDLINGVA
jgi:hypothetical protein